MADVVDADPVTVLAEDAPEHLVDTSVRMDENVVVGDSMGHPAEAVPETEAASSEPELEMSTAVGSLTATDTAAAIASAAESAAGSLNCEVEYAVAMEGPPEERILREPTTPSPLD